MSPSPDSPLTDLFVRYWDNALAPADHDELAARLVGDPAAREEFRRLSLQAVAAAEPGLPPAPAGSARRLSRRQLLGLVGGGVAAGVVATVLGRRFWWAGGEADESVRLTAAVGEVTLKTPGGEVAAAAGPIPAEAVVATVGQSSSAVLRFADGSDVSLGGESAVTVAGQGRKVHLLRGTATATVPAAGAEPITLGTTEATCSRLGGAVLTLSRTIQATEVGVQTGRASVADAAGDPLEIVHPGEYLTVRSDGRHRKQPVEPVAEDCKWDLTRPLPEGWAVGKIDAPNAGPPALVPVRWFDPYHQAEMYQVRSDHRWYQGFARLHRRSRFVVRYRADKAGPGQLVACVRKDDLGSSDTGVIEWNGTFRAAEPGQWHTLDVPAGDMLDNKHTPKFGAPWVAFLIIFNTYKEDLGLRIADFQVIPPGPAA